MGEQVRIYEYDEWDRCELCAEWWCPRCDKHACDCPCLTLQMAIDLDMELSKDGRFAEPRDDAGG